MNYAGFIKRFLARFVDSLVLVPIMIFNFFVVKPNSNETFLLISTSTTIISILYHILFNYIWGKTPGKRLLRIKVVKTDGNKVKLINSILRELLFIISFFISIVRQYKLFREFTYIGMIGFIYPLFLIIDAFTYFFNYRCKTIHDYIADTIVIDEIVKTTNESKLKSYYKKAANLNRR